MEAKTVVIESIKEYLGEINLTDLEIPIAGIEGADSMSILLIYNKIESITGKTFSFSEMQEVELVTDLIEITRKALHED